MRLSQLSPVQRRQLVEAIQDAFPTPEALEQMVFFAFGQSLPQIAGGGSLGEMVLDLLVWADGERKLDELIAAARDANPGNVALRAVSDVLAGGAAGGYGVAAPPRIFLVPYPRNPQFVGRQAELQQLQDLLDAGGTVVVSGAGGMGKTQLAVEFAYRGYDAGIYPGGIFWIQMEPAEGIAHQVAALAGPRGLNLPGFDPAELERNVAAVRREWEGPERRLLVFDNLDNPTLLQQWRPLRGGSRTFITSRNGNWPARLGVRVLRLGPLTRSETLELLLGPRAGWAGLSSLLGDPALRATADAICDELGDLPLAVALASAYLEANPSVTLDSYLARLRTAQLDHPSLDADLDIPLPTGHHQSLATTFALSYERLDPARQVDALALALLHLASWCAHAPIPRRLLLRAAGLDPDDNSAEERAAQALARLIGLGLMEELLPDSSLRVQRLVASYARDRAPDPIQDAASVEQALIAEVSAIRRAGYPLAAAPYGAHLQHAVSLARDRVDEDTARLLENLAAVLHDQGDLAAARPLYERALAIMEQALGPNHPSSAHSLNNLGRLLHDQGDLAAARPLYELALAICEQALGPNHPDTATSLNNLGRLLDDQGDLAGARPLYERALAIREQALGPNHPGTASSLNNLAMLLQDMGAYDAARPLYERALAIREQVLGSNHPDTAHSLNNLGRLLHDQGDLAGARPLYERALAITEQVLGPNHPDTAHSLNNLGRLLHDQGDLAGARPLYERALDIQALVLGPIQADTASTLSDLAQLLLAQGESARGREMLRDSAEIFEQTLGREHPRTLNTLELLAGLDPAPAVPSADAAAQGDAAQVGDSLPAGVEYEVVLSLPAGPVPVGGSCEALVELVLAGRALQSGKLLMVPRKEAEHGELNALINASGLMVEGQRGASLLLRPDIEAQRTARFSLVGLLPGPATVGVDLWRGSVYVTSLEARVEIAAIENPPVPRSWGTRRSHPVPGPDLALHVQTEWNAERTVCSLRYVLHSYKSGSLPAEGRVYQSGQLPGYWLRQVRALLQAALEEADGAQPEDGLARLMALGRYFSRWLLPEGLWDDLREQGAVGSTLLIVADEEGWAPWELLHDGWRFLGQRFVVGRWPREIEDACPYEFPVGAVHVGYYEQIEQPERWLQLLRAGGAPEPILLPGGVLADLGTAEDMRGLHLVQTATPAARGGHDAPVLYGDGDGAADKGALRRARLNMYRNRPLVTLSYLSAGWAQLTELEQQWLPGFLRAGCSAFAGPLWAVRAEVDAAFTRAFYARLWAGDALGMAFSTARRMARVAAPESFDWLAYVMAGDPLARPYRPVTGYGYAIVQAIGRELDDPLEPGQEALFRVSLSRTPPIWHEERVIEVVESFSFAELQVHLVAFGLEVQPGTMVPMTHVNPPAGDYYGWFTLVAPTEMAGGEGLVQVYFASGTTPLNSLTFAFPIGGQGDAQP